MIDMSIKLEGMDALQRRLGAIEREMDKAVVMGINKTATKAKTEIKKAISSEFVIKQKDITPRLRVVKASKSSLTATIDPFAMMKRGRSLHLSNFIIGRTPEKYLRKKGVRPSKQKAIKVRVKKGGAAKTVRGAFLIRGKTSGKLIMMQRKGKSQYPIKTVRTVDVPSMFASRKVMSRVMTRVRKELPIEVERAVKHVISKRK